MQSCARAQENKAGNYNNEELHKLLLQLGPNIYLTIPLYHYIYHEILLIPRIGISPFCFIRTRSPTISVNGVNPCISVCISDGTNTCIDNALKIQVEYLC